MGAGREPDPVHTEVLRLATWRAARSGLGGQLVDPSTGHAAQAVDVVHRLLDHVTPALRDGADLDAIQRLLAAVLGRGTGADRQRAVHDRTGDLGAVVRDAVAAGPEPAS